MIINIEVNNKIAVPINPPEIICGNSDYVIEFTLDSEWDNHGIKTAIFTYKRDGQRKCIEVVFEGTKCPVPILSGIDEVFVGIYVGDLQTTTPAVLACKKSALCDVTRYEDPPSNIYDQLLKILSSEYTVGAVTELREIIDNLTAADVDALPLTGGILTGPLKAEQICVTNPSYALEIGRYIDFHDNSMDGDYDIRLAVSADKNLIFKRIGDGENQYYKIYGEHNKNIMPFLANTGGTLTGNLKIFKEYPVVRLGIDDNNCINFCRTENGNTDINNTLNGKTTTLSIMNDSKENTSLASILQLWASDGKNYAIFGAHNKPSGSYNGTYDTDVLGGRTINIGGAGNVLFILVYKAHDNGDIENGGAIVTPHGYSYVYKQRYSGDNRYCGSGIDMTYSNGVLIIPDKCTFNKMGFTYYWYCL